MDLHAERSDKRLVELVLAFCEHIAGLGKEVAACVCGDSALGLFVGGVTTQVLLVVRDFQPRLLPYLKVFDGRAVVVLAVDKWVFERDVDRGFLGEALAGGLIFPYKALTGGDYLRVQEVKLKKRLICELLGNLVSSFPELSYEILIEPQYFIYETILSRARLFPPTMYRSLSFVQEREKAKDIGLVLDGYVEALKELDREGVICFSEGHVKIAKSFISNSKKQKARFIGLFRPAQRTLFASLVGALPRITSYLSQNRESLLSFQRISRLNLKIASQFEIPHKYVFVPTAQGLVSLADKTNIESFARKVLSTSKKSEVEIEAIGGVLNDVYLIKALADGEERKVVVKRFRDWSSFKWFPLTLWAAGTKTFAVLGRSRLEREVAINQLLDSKGFDVPKILYVSSEERLVFMEYVEGVTVDKVIKRAAISRSSSEARKDLKTIERVGKRFAKVHALGIALGDTKPENVMIGEHGEIYLIDFEQAARNGDRVWDIAEFLYYAGHDMSTLAEAKVAERIAEAFVTGYLEGGGKIDTLVKASTARYTKVFSIFTLPHLMLAISNVCRNAGKMKG